MTVRVVFLVGWLVGLGWFIGSSWFMCFVDRLIIFGLFGKMILWMGLDSWLVDWLVRLGYLTG